jgi:ribosomal protein L22
MKQSSKKVDSKKVEIHINLDKELRRIQQAVSNLCGVRISKKKASEILPNIKNQKVDIRKEIKEFLEG